MSEKYLKKLIGKNDIEDALKRLDKLTNEEVRMVTAQVLEATHTVDDKVGRVEDKVLEIDNKVSGVDDRVAGVGDRVARVNDRVAGIDDRVTGVDDRVARVDDKVAGVDDRVARVDERVAGVDDCVKAIDDKVAVVVDGAQPSLISQQPNIINSDAPRGKRDEGNHATSRRRHGSSEALVFFFCIDIGMQAKASFQGINYNKTFADGSHRQIPLLIITLPAALIASKRPSGFSKEVFSPNGNPMAHFCGYTENVRSPDLSRADAR